MSHTYSHWRVFPERSDINGIDTGVVLMCLQGAQCGSEEEI